MFCFNGSSDEKNTYKIAFNSFVFLLFSLLRGLDMNKIYIVYTLYIYTLSSMGGLS